MSYEDDPNLAKLPKEVYEANEKMRKLVEDQLKQIRDNPPPKEDK